MAKHDTTDATDIITTSIENPPARIEPDPGQLRLGTIAVDGPRELVATASIVATELAQVIEKQTLFVEIRNKRHVLVEGWTTAAAMLGLSAREVSVTPLQDEVGYEAVVELVRPSDGAVISRASSICAGDESRWADAPRYAIRSMAVTRATGKACRLALSWIVTLAGFSPTPAEEMPRDDDPPRRRVDSRPATSQRQAAIPPAQDPKVVAGLATLTSLWQAQHPDKDRSEFISWASERTTVDASALKKPSGWSMAMIETLRQELESEEIPF